MKDIIQLSTGSSNVLLVSLQDYSEQIFLQKDEGDEELTLFFAIRNKQWPNGEFDFKILPPGNWIEVGWSDSLTEDQTAELVEAYKVSTDTPFNNTIKVTRFKKHLSEDRFELTALTALESWQSLLSANNIKERKFVLRDNNK